MNCFQNQTEIHLGMIAARLNQQDKVCSIAANLEPQCVEFLDECDIYRSECKEALRSAFRCIPYINSINSTLENAGIDSAAIFVDSAIKFNDKAKECTPGEEYKDVKPPLWWEQHCDDHKLTPLSFMSLNQNYYDGESPEARALLLERFSLSRPDTEKWKRVVATLMALESLDSDHPEEKAMAAKVLGVHGDFSVPVIFGLLQKLNDPSVNVRKEAAFALRTQGNRKPLVVFSLLSLILDSNESPSVKGAASLALREQATTFPCTPGEEEVYHMQGTEIPNSLQQGIPQCVSYDSDSHEDSVEEGNYYSDTESCRGDYGRFSNRFDRYSNPSSIKDFDIGANLCYLNATVRPSKINRIAQISLFQALQAEENSQAKAEMIASLRNLGKPINGDETIINTLRSHYLADEDWRVRRAVVFALAKAAKDKSWFFQSTIPYILQNDPSPSVRATAVAAISDSMTLTMESKTSYYQAYINGLNIHNSQAQDCASSQSISIIDSTPSDHALSQFYTLGFIAAQQFFTDKACGEAEEQALPILLKLYPNIGDREVGINPTIVIDFEGIVSDTMLKSHLELYGPGAVKIPIKLINYRQNMEQNTTHAEFTLSKSLQYDNYYQIKFLAGMRTNSQGDHGEGYYYSRSALFQTASTGLSPLVASLMEIDPDTDVQYRAAETFIKNNEYDVIQFLMNKLLVEPSRNMVRASSYLNSPLIKYRQFIDAEDEQKLKFIKPLFKKIINFIDQQEKLYNFRNVNHKSYLATPSFTSFYRLINDLLSKHWISHDMKIFLDRELDIKRWLLEKLRYDYPRVNYSFYERIYYSQVRDLIKSIINTHFISLFDDDFKNVDYIIYHHEDNPFLMSEEQD